MSKLDPPLNKNDVEVISRERGHDGFLRVDFFQLKHRLIEGGWSEILRRELLVKDEAVGLLLFDPVRDEVVLVRQFRIGTLDDLESPWMLELVAGMAVDGEELEQVAIRESQEESDCTPEDLIKICEYHNSPGTSNEKVTLFCGRVDASEAGGVFGLDHEHEDIEVVVLSYNDVLQALESGYLNNAMSIIAIQWLELNRKNLLEKWLAD